MTQRYRKLGFTVTNSTYLLLSAMVLFAQPAFAWESDVHYGLTNGWPSRPNRAFARLST